MPDPRFAVLVSVAFPYMNYYQPMVVSAEDADEAVRAVADAVHDSGAWPDYHVKVESQEHWRLTTCDT